MARPKTRLTRSRSAKRPARKTARKAVKRTVKKTVKRKRTSSAKRRK